MLPLSNIKKEQTTPKEFIIDINCDLGQSFGVYKNESEESLIPYVSSVNIACGAHSGDPVTIMKALKLAQKHNLSIGAHIGYPDIQGFGYRSLKLTSEEIQAMVVFQIGALNAMAKYYNRTVEYVRPHGALHKDILTNIDTAVAVSKGIANFDKWLILVGAPSKNLEEAGDTAGIRIAKEFQPIKNYTENGEIDFEREDIEDINFCMSQINSLVKDSFIKTVDKKKIIADFNTIHLDLRSEKSIELAKKIQAAVDKTAPIPATFVMESGWLS